MENSCLLLVMASCKNEFVERLSALLLVSYLRSSALSDPYALALKLGSE